MRKQFKFVMEVEKLEEAGYTTAMMGLSMNKKQPVNNMPKLSKKLFKMAPSHSKFLRQMYVSFKIKAPTYWWGEFDTYKIGTVAQSTSIMHTFEKEVLEQEDNIDLSGFFEDNFEHPEMYVLDNFRQFVYLTKHKKFDILRSYIPSGYLYTRVVSMNYMVLRTMIKDRANHRLPHWKSFIEQACASLEHKEYVGDLV